MSSSPPAALLALALLLAPTLLPTARGDWAFVSVSHEPPSPDHEEPVLFRARLAFFNATEGNASDGTANETGNSTGGTGGGPGSASLLGVQLVFGIDSPSGESRVNMSEVEAGNWSAEFAVSLGPFSPGLELLYRFEALLSNGSNVTSNLSRLRTQDIVEIKWHAGLEEALELARALGRPVLLLIYDPFRPLAELEEALGDPRALALSARFVCARASSSAEPSLMERYGVRSLPALVFLNGCTGEPIRKREGPFSGAELAREMRAALGAARPPDSGPDPFIIYRAGAAALSASIVVGLAALLALLRRRRGA